MYSPLAQLHYILTLWHSPSGTLHTSTMYSPSGTTPGVHCTPPLHTHPLAQPLGYTAHLHYILTLAQPLGYTAHLHYILTLWHSPSGTLHTSTMYLPSDTAPRVHCTPPPRTLSVVGCTRREGRATRPSIPPRRNNGPCKTVPTRRAFSRGQPFFSKYLGFGDKNKTKFEVHNFQFCQHE